jgi:N-methylhydantoinase A
MLDLERTRRITAEWLKTQRSHLSLEQFALGVVRVVNANMERALRVVSIERGYDPRDFALVAFGGAGGLHACELAEALALPTVIIPARPGALSAFGILVSDVVKDFSRTLLWRLQGTVPHGELRKEFRKLEAAAQKSFAEERWPYHRAIHYEKSLDLRYRGQGYELNVPASGDIIARFHDEHRRRYGYHHAGREIELVTLRLRARLRTPQPTPQRKTAKPPVRRGPAVRVAPVERARVVFEKAEVTAVSERSQLAENSILRGPAVITEYSATTVIPPGRKFWVDSQQNLIVELKSARMK